MSTAAAGRVSSHLRWEFTFEKNDNTLTRHNTSVGCIWPEGQSFTSDVVDRHCKQRELRKGKEALRAQQ